MPFKTKRAGKLEFTSNDGFGVQMNKKPRLKHIVSGKGVTRGSGMGGSN